MYLIMSATITSKNIFDTPHGSSSPTPSILAFGVNSTNS